MICLLHVLFVNKMLFAQDLISNWRTSSVLLMLYKFSMLVIFSLHVNTLVLLLSNPAMDRAKVFPEYFLLHIIMVARACTGDTQSGGERSVWTWSIIQGIFTHTTSSWLLGHVLVTHSLGETGQCGHGQ